MKRLLWLFPAWICASVINFGFINADLKTETWYGQPGFHDRQIAMTYSAMPVMGTVIAIISAISGHGFDLRPPK